MCIKKHLSLVEELLSKILGLDLRTPLSNKSVFVSKSSSSYILKPMSLITGVKSVLRQIVVNCDYYWDFTLKFINLMPCLHCAMNKWIMCQFLSFYLADYRYAFSDEM